MLHPGKAVTNDARCRYRDTVISNFSVDGRLAYSDMVVLIGILLIRTVMEDAQYHHGVPEESSHAKANVLYYFREQ